MDDKRRKRILICISIVLIIIVGVVAVKIYNYVNEKTCVVVTLAGVIFQEKDVIDGHLACVMTPVETGWGEYDELVGTDIILRMDERFKDCLYSSIITGGKHLYMSVRIEIVIPVKEAKKLGVSINAATPRDVINILTNQELCDKYARLVIVQAE